MRPVLGYTEFWKGLRRGRRNPNDFTDYDFTDYVDAGKDQADGTETEFKRGLTLASGAVQL